MGTNVGAVTVTLFSEQCTHMRKCGKMKTCNNSFHTSDGKTCPADVQLLQVFSWEYEVLWNAHENSFLRTFALMYGWIGGPVCLDRKPAGWWLEDQWGQKCRQDGVPGFDLGIPFQLIWTHLRFVHSWSKSCSVKVSKPEVQSFEQWHRQQARPGSNSQEPASEICRLGNQQQFSPSL